MARPSIKKGDFNKEKAKQSALNFARKSFEIEGIVFSDKKFRTIVTELQGKESLKA